MSDYSQLSDADLLAAYKSAKASPFDAALTAEGADPKIAEIARSIYQQESSSGKNAKTSNAGAVGGMQIIPGTFKSVADKDWDINDPTQNARAGIRYIKQLYEQAGGDPALTAAGYYGGPGGLEKARRGVAVSDPRNPGAPTTLQYGQQVAARIPKEKGLIQRGVEAVIPSANAEEVPANQFAGMSDEDLLAQYQKAQAAPAAPEGGGAAFGVFPNARRKAQNNTPNASDAIIMGGARGVKDVIDTGAQLLSRVAGPEEAARVQAMNDAGKADFKAQYGNSGLASAARFGGNMVATAPVGGMLGAPLRAAAPIFEATPAIGVGLNRLANSLASSGFSTGAAPTTMGGATANMLARMAGGAGTGYASAGLVDPNAAGSGAAIGALLPPAVRLAGGAGGATVGAARGVSNMATQAGQNRIAEEILRSSATNPEAAAAALSRGRAVLPGSNPTMAQVANDPGLAQLERTLLNNPEIAPGLQSRFAEQRAARSGAIDDIAGRGTYYNDIKEGRAVFAKEDYDKALNAKIDPAKAEEMAPQIADLVERPSIKSAILDAKRLAAETGENVGDIGSVRGLDWVKKALDNKISMAGSPGSGIGKADLAALNQTKKDLMSTIEQLSPGYKEANDNFAAMSRQINSMDVARNLDKAYTPVAANFGQSAKEQGNAYMKALTQAKDSVKKSTGMDRELSDVMNTGDIYQLENVGRDLARKQYAESAGAATGSPTAQNLMSQQMIRRIMEGAGLPSGAVEAAAGSTALNTLMRPVEFAGKLALPKVNNRLAELALDPQKAAEALRGMPPEQAAAALAQLPPNRLMTLARALGRNAPSIMYRAAPVVSAE